jgi:quercetin dioxygenase-like cupin family protein
VRKFLIIGIAIPVAAVSAAVAFATPGAGVLSAPLLARAAFGGDVTLQSKPNQATGLTWRGREWKAEQLPEFLRALRDQGKVADLGAWVTNHPAAASAFGLPAARKVPAADFAVQQVTLAPGGATGWHTHPGPALVLVRTGEFTLYNAEAGCTPTTYKAGQSFVDAGFGNVHIGRNEAPAGNVELYVVYLAPAGAGVRIDAPKPAASTCNF